MEVLRVTDFHTDHRRNLVAWKSGKGEIKQLNITQDNIELGNHSHNCGETYILATGKCELITWTKKLGKKNSFLMAPQVIKIAPHEEHLFFCAKGTILVGIVPQEFNTKGVKPAKHLK